MENASKAMLIAGGVLIAMLVMSIGVYLFANYSNIGSSYDQELESTEIQKFNANFIKFEGRSDITIHEIVTIVEFTKQYKKQTEIDIPVTISSDELKDNDTIELIKANVDKKFELRDLKYDNSGKVSLICFIKNT